MDYSSGSGEYKKDGRWKRRVLPVAEAQRRVLLLAAARRTASELTPLAACGGRRLAESLRATSDWPPFARAGLDGYAVRAADTALASPQAPATLRVVDSVAAGGLASATITPGTAARIMTGAAVPEGADAVVMLEQTAEAAAGGEPAARMVRIAAAASPGQHVAPRGEEFRLGSPIVEAGELLAPGHVALLGTFGYAAVPVYKRPRVAIFATGSELLPVEAPLVPGRIRDSNSAMVDALVRECGAEPLMCGTLPDDPVALRAALAEASERAELIVTTGGVSVGDYDAMAELLRELEAWEEAGSSYSADEGLEEVHTDSTGVAEASGRGGQGSMLLFNRVSMRPGSPTSAALLNGRLVLALSGNPGACFVGFELFAGPALRAMQGAASPDLPSIKAVLGEDYSKGSPHTRYVRAKLRFGEDGRVYADAARFGKSSMMASLAESDGFAVIPSGSRGAAAGELVQVLLLKRFYS
ncbi:gephyrin-like molybdotransferase Glp [Paenibacillus sp. PL2-23]|uniref:molybdopterin molybdotransferase MoeA n=1 Tax=Paenibacillus sp. PL2-23 TaxID=2100729 RepID=UPI0030FA9E32